MIGADEIEKVREAASTASRDHSPENISHCQCRVCQFKRKGKDYFQWSRSKRDEWIKKELKQRGSKEPARLPARPERAVEVVVTESNKSVSVVTAVGITASEAPIDTCGKAWTMRRQGSSWAEIEASLGLRRSNGMTAVRCCKRWEAENIQAGDLT